MLPLQGIRILDLSRVLAGPWCTQLLGDMGADVIKVEEPANGDESRGWGKGLGGRESTYYLSANRSKRGIAVDLQTPEGQALVREMALQVDVVIENFKLGTMERFGLDYATLSAANPRLVYCSISGYGRTGKFAQRLGYDVLIQAETGLMNINGTDEQEPIKFGVAIVDLTTGMYAVQAILAALVGRQTTQRGQRIDLALFDCGLSLLSYYATKALVTQEDPARYGNAHPDVVPYGRFETADGPVIIACGNDRQFRKLCLDVLNRPDLADDARFIRNQDRANNRAELVARMQETLGRMKRAEFVEAMARAGIPSGEVRGVLEALNSPEARERESVRYTDHPTLGHVGVAYSPYRFSDAPPREFSLPPSIGEHTGEVLRDFGLSEERVAELRRLKVIA